MKRILIVLEEKEYNKIKKVKKYNHHTWHQVLNAYVDTYKKEE